jgi:hypothetical protein
LDPQCAVLERVPALNQLCHFLSDVNLLIRRTLLRLAFGTCHASSIRVVAAAPNSSQFEAWKKVTTRYGATSRNCEGKAVPALNLSREKFAILLTIFSEPTIPQPESPKKAPPDFNPSGAHSFKTGFPRAAGQFVAV